MNDGWNINAGIDESNAKEGIVFLPKDAFFSAEMIRSHLKKRFHVKKIGVIVTDTKSLPLRVGTIGRSIGFAGFEPIKSYIGKKDIFGRKSRVTKSNFVDALSAAAVMIMGEGNEKTPIAIIENAPVKFISRPLLAKEKILSISPNKDIFAAVYKVC
jgi:F420-0:gamma-glutamyl ligase